jgi:hypothetical protein
MLPNRLACQWTLGKHRPSLGRSRPTPRAPALAGFLLLVGCSGDAVGQGDAVGKGDALGQLRSETVGVSRAEFSATTSIPSNRAPSVRVTVTDAGKAQSLYSATLALPPFPQPPHRWASCPIDFGIFYHLVFEAAASEVMTADLQPGGCETVTLQKPDGLPIYLSAVGSGYWSTLAATLGIPESKIFPYVPPGL